MKFLLKYILLFSFALSLHSEILYRVDNDSSQKKDLLNSGASIVAEYAAFTIVSMPESKSSAFTVNSSSAPIALQDLEDVSYMREINLNSGMIKTTDKDETLKTFSVASTTQSASSSGMMLMQFIGPVKTEWINDVTERTDLKFVCYIPNNAYLVSGTQDQFNSLENLNLPYVHWIGEYSNNMRIQPDAKQLLAVAAPENISTYDVQLFLDEQKNIDTFALLEKYSGKFKNYKIDKLKVVNCVVELSGAQVVELSKQPDVISINLHHDMKLHGERQALIMADKFLPDGTLPLPRTDSYLQWFLSKGFTQQQFIDSGFIVDVTDDGFDNGNAVTPGNSEFCVSNNPAASSRVAYAEIGQGTSGISNPAGAAGHGNLNLSIIGGFNNGTGTPTNVDPQDYHYGLGIVPFAMLGSTKIFADSGAWGNPNYSQMVNRQYSNGARIHSDSWGANTPLYTVDAQTFDYLTRDASTSLPGNQEMVFVFSAGNVGPNASSMGSPGTAKNVFTVGGSKTYDADLNYTDGSNVGPSGANNVNDIISFSSRGPTKDGRIKPDIVAPATHIHGAASQYAGYVGDGVSDKYNPIGQTKYAESSGTSHSCPAVAAASALLRQWFINNGNLPPSPAMNKAWIMNSARYLTGEYADDDLPSNSQGMGTTSLETMLDDTDRSFVDQNTNNLFTDSGQEFSFVGEITDTQKVFRVTLAWTDALGSTTGAAYVNDLDLIVLVNNVPYYGNVFSHDTSVQGGSGDRINNVESVFLPAGISGTVEVKVISVNIAGDGVPVNEYPLDQDFALVTYNANLHEKESGELTVTPSLPANFLLFNEQSNIYPENNTYTLGNTGDVSIAWNSYLGTNVFDVQPASGVLAGHTSQDVVVSVYSNMYSPGIYSDILAFTNLYSGTTINRVLNLDVRAHDFYTEEFVGGVNDLSYQSIVFIENGTSYDTYINSVSEFYINLDNATQISMGDDTIYNFVLSNGNTFPFFSSAYSSLYISSNGRITLGQGSTQYLISLANYFALPAISAMFADLSPQNGKVYIEELSDRAIVTFVNVPGYNETTTSSYQIECFFDGTVRITYEKIDITRIFITGLSEGNGIPANFQESDFSSYQELNYNMQITPPDDLTFVGVEQGEVTPSELWFELLNTGDEAIHWQLDVSSSNNWLSAVGGNSGTLESGISTNIAFTADYGVGGLQVGDVYSGTIALYSQENSISEIFDIALSYEDPLKILPDQSTFLFTKANALNYAPEKYELILTNRASTALNWEAYRTQANEYIDFSSMSGTLAAYEGTVLDATVKSGVIDLNSIYQETLVISNTLSSVGNSQNFMVRNIPDYFTQVFMGDAQNLSNKSLLFVPDAGNTNYYVAYCNDIEQLFVEPSGIPVELTDDGIANIQVNAPGGISFYGTSYSNLFINGNGRVTFTEGSSEYNPTVADHFALPSVAPLFTDLSPQEGEVFYNEFVDRFVISYINVPEFDTENRSSFQIEFFFNGNVRLTYGDVDALGNSIAGLSKGSGTPSGFVESDMFAYAQYPYDALSVTPEEGYVIHTRENIDINEYIYEFTVHNISESTLHWTAAASENWIAVLPAFGSIPAGESIIVTGTVDHVVNSFVFGKYTNYIEFANFDSSTQQQVPVLLDVSTGIGQVEISGSLPTINETVMPFGNQQLDISRTESIYVKNIDSQYPVTIENIRLNKKSVPVDMNFTMTNKTVLLYADDYLNPKTLSYPYQVLTSMGANVTVYGYGEVALFHNALVSQQWDMVIFSSEYYFLPNYNSVTALENALIDFTKSGKPLIAGSWCAAYWGSDLWRTLGGEVEGDAMIDEPVNIVGLDDSEMFFEQPKSVPNPITYSYAYFDYYGCSATLNPDEFAMPIATFSIESDYSILYMENTVYKGFIDAEFDVASGIKDLWYNMIYNVNVNSFEKQNSYQSLLPITINPGETYAIPIDFNPNVLDYYESELFISFEALNKTNVSIDVTGTAITSDDITTGYSRWRDQYGDHLLITNSLDVGEVTSATIGGLAVKDIVKSPMGETIEFVFDEINSTNLLDVVYQARAGEFTVTNLFAYYSEYVYVSPSGLATNGFNTWENASKTIQEAIDEAEEWALVQVASAIYTKSPASRPLSHPTASVTNVVVINKNIVLRGITNPIINGADMYRPVLMIDGTVLDGFWLINGKTKDGANYYIENNGGGIWAQSHAAVVKGGNIIYCYAGYYGGGIFGATVRDSVIEDCSALYGGGLGHANAETNVEVALCDAEYGGGVANSIVANSEIYSNTSTFGGGATDSDISSSILYNNTASYGGAIFGDSKSSTIINCLLHSNGADYEGGGFYQNPYIVSKTTFVNSTVTENWHGLDNCGGVFNADIINSIVYGNTGTDFVGGSDAYYSNIGVGVVPPNQGNISIDPLFSTNMSYELSASSPCIDAGLNAYVTSALDLLGNTRIAHGTVDMGAYELPWYTIVSSSVGPGDIDPQGTFDVPQGTNMLFVATPDEHYKLVSFATNSYLVAGTETNFEWLILDDGTIVATFDEIIVTNGMPQLWLAQFYPGETDYEALANMDTDGDGLVSWQEYVALTIPTNEESLFQTLVTISSNGVVVSWSPFDDNLRTYSLDGTTNLISPYITISNDVKNGSMTLSTNGVWRYFKSNVKE
ncbi:MAG: S8 family serine peptidase [Kiritimatiellae bacterium]|jgi:hypothetical protein|nr:S8 family serine peptidase [Kiritimatiellia bacterium]